MSTGLYNHTTRATGTILTAAIYNADHQNHITNQNPTMTGALSDNLSEHQSVMDPGDLGTEVLASNLADELKQLRFVVKRITGKAQWYIPPATDLQSVGGTLQTLTVAKSAAFQGDLTPPQIVANQNNYAPTGHADAFRFRLSTDASREITGIAGGASGRFIVIENIGAQSMTLKNEDAASTAANRFLFGANVIIRPNASLALQYDNVLSRWTAVNTALVSNPTLDGNITFAGNTFQAGYTEVTASGTPAAPATTKLRAYAKDVGSGVAKLAFIDKDGLETIVTPPRIPRRAYAEYKSGGSIFGSIPYDDTIPQNTEGAQILSVSITPQDITSRVRITFGGWVSTNSQIVTAALFKDSDVDALQAAAVCGSIGCCSAFAAEKYLGFTFEHAPATLSPITYKIRVGAVSGAFVFNGTPSGARRFGGASATVLVVEEIFI